MAVELMKLPDSLFSKAVKRLDLVKVQLLNANDRRALKERDPNYDGYKDIHIMTGDNANTLISRDELLRNYVNCNGKKIKIMGWHYHKQYLVCRTVYEELRVLKVPRHSKRTILVGGRVIPKPCIVVCRVTPNGIDKAHPRILTRRADIENFRRTCIVTELADMVKAAGDAHEKKMISQIQVAREKESSRKVWNPVISGQKHDELEVAPYTAVGRAVNRMNRLIGFAIRENKTGNTTVINLTQAKELCMNKKINNITIAMIQETGKIYFRGVGIRIENLPVKMYDV